MIRTLPRYLLCPAFAFFGVDAISRKGQEAFYRARYLLFAMSTSGNSFDLFVKNESRMLSIDERDDAESTWVQSYAFDNYNFDEIQQHVEKYLIEELSYFQKNFHVELEEWEREL